jgi:hypothetical protein
VGTSAFPSVEFSGNEKKLDDKQINEKLYVLQFDKERLDYSTYAIADVSNSKWCHK